MAANGSVTMNGKSLMGGMKNHGSRDLREGFEQVGKYLEEGIQSNRSSIKCMLQEVGHRAKWVKVLRRPAVNYSHDLAKAV